MTHTTRTNQPTHSQRPALSQQLALCTWIAPPLPPPSLAACCLATSSASWRLALHCSGQGTLLFHQAAQQPSTRTPAAPAGGWPGTFWAGQAALITVKPPSGSRALQGRWQGIPSMRATQRLPTTLQQAHLPISTSGLSGVPPMCSGRPVPSGSAGRPRDARASPAVRPKSLWFCLSSGPRADAVAGRQQ